jgi:hypothetical protein
MFKYLTSDALQHSLLLDETDAYVNAPLNAPLANHVPLDASMGNAKQKYFDFLQHDAERTRYFADRKNVLMVLISTRQSQTDRFMSSKPCQEGPEEYLFPLYRLRDCDARGR